VFYLSIDEDEDLVIVRCSIDTWYGALLVKLWFTYCKSKFPVSAQLLTLTRFRSNFICLQTFLPRTSSLVKL
jgi:hypothetical protein